MDTICINCPMGCPLHIEEKDGKITVSGNTCKRGETYGVSEFTKPVRMVTSLVKGNGGVVSVKTSAPVDKDKIFEVLKEISKIELKGKVSSGDVIAKNVSGSGADLVVTSNV